MSKEKTKTENRKKTSVLWLIAVCIIAVSLLLFCQFYFGDAVNSKTTFYSNTHINGVDVSGMTKEEASSVLSQKLADNKDNIEIKLKNDDKEWTLKGSDFEIVGNFDEPLDNVINYGREGNIFQKKKIENKIKNEGLYVNIPYQNMLGGIDEKIENIIQEVEKVPQEAKICFNPNSTNMFALQEGENGVKVDRIALEQEINEALENYDSYVINIPFQEIMPENDMSLMLKDIKLRAKFSTNYAKSSNDRKNNIKKALSAFDGMVVEPEQEVSFNKTTGPRTSANGYKTAKIIFNGSYISGVGGGVCQASTTLYNALLRADVDVLQVNHHSLPASYVPLSFDAMVNEGYSDLIFKNNLETPIYIKAYGTDEEAIVEIYGQPLEEGVEIKTRAELVKVLPHGGDKIITDEEGKYADKVLYKGEYYRLKYPQEGYESKGYIQYYKDGKLIKEKEIRHDHYIAQQGVIVQGSASLEDGMTLPASNVKYISPQKVTKQTTENAKKKFNII